MNANSCHTRQALSLAGSINYIDPTYYAHVDMGVAVQPSAMGTPVTIYSLETSGSQANALLAEYGIAVVRTTQCVPIMRQNPFKCRPGGTLVINSENQLTATSADGLCSSTFQYRYLDNLSQSKATLSFMCPTNGSSGIGKGTIVISAAYTYAKWLGIAMNDTDAPLDPPPGYTYAVTCSVDTSNTFSYHNVTLGFQGLGNSSQPSFARFLSGSSKPCIPRYPTIGNVLFASAAGAHWQLLNENRGVDGYFDTLSYIALP